MMHCAVVVTYLERTEPPEGEPVPAPEGVRVMRANPPTVGFYRFLYDAVGQRWRWTDRQALDDDELGRIVQHPDVHVHVLYRQGTPAGYVELDYRGEEVQIAYFGLLPECIGQGLGRFLMDWALREAWTQAPGRIWVHTCTDDHPEALAFYRKNGFVAYRTERESS